MATRVVKELEYLLHEERLRAGTDCPGEGSGES